MIQPPVAQTGKKCHRAIIYANTKYDVLTIYWLIWVIMTSYSYNTLMINWNYVCKKMRLQAVCPGLFIFIDRVIFGVSWSSINCWFYYDYFITQIIISKSKLYISMYLQQLYNTIFHSSFQTQQYIITEIP